MSVKGEMLKTLIEKKCLDDIKTLKNKKQLASLWFKELRDKICKSFEEIENDKTNKEKMDLAFSKIELGDYIEEQVEGIQNKAGLDAEIQIFQKKERIFQNQFIQLSKSMFFFHNFQIL